MKAIKAIVFVAVFTSAAANAVGSTAGIDTSSKENCNGMGVDAQKKVEAKTALAQYEGRPVKQQSTSRGQDKGTKQ